MQGDPMIYLIVAIITALGSAGAWKFYADWRKDRREDNTHYTRYIKEDYKQRIESLEEQLSGEKDANDELWRRVVEIEIQFSEVNVKLVYLEQENNRLKNELKVERDTNLRLLKDLKERTEENRDLIKELTEVRNRNTILLEELNANKKKGDE